MTLLVLEDSQDRQNNPEFPSRPGTTSTITIQPATKRLIVPILMGTALSFGTITAASPADAAALRARASETSTQSGRAEDSIPADISKDIAAAVRRLHLVSGLTWAELADAAGVSRRAVHHWAAGRRVSSRHIKRIGALISLVNVYDAGNPDETRARLLGPDQSGRTPLQAFAEKDRVSTTRLPAQVPLLRQILIEDERAGIEPPLAPTRRSSVSPRRTPGRRARPRSHD